MSQSSISKNNLLTTLDWFLFFILCILAFWFCWPILVGFRENETSFSQSNEDITGRPTITICFETRPDPTEIFLSEKNVPEVKGLRYDDDDIDDW